MGREIRRVPPNWEHPRNEKGDYISMYDQDFESACKEWKRELVAWENGTHPERETSMEYWEYAGDPPDRDSYRPKFTEEPTWYQVYETVSEGTPVTPPFPTVELLAEYLSQHGDFAYQEGYREISPKPTYEQALKFIKQGFAPSMIIMNGKMSSTYDTIK